MSVESVARASERKTGVLVLVVTITMVGSIWFLLHQQRKAHAKSIHCVSNLNHIRLAKSACQEDLKIADRETIPEELLRKTFERDLGKPLAQYKCPSGGTYMIGTAGVAPKCSYTNINYTYRIEWILRLERRARKHSIE